MSRKKQKGHRWTANACLTCAKWSNIIPNQREKHQMSHRAFRFRSSRWRFVLNHGSDQMEQRKVDATLSFGNQNSAPCESAFSISNVSVEGFNFEFDAFCQVADPTLDGEPKYSLRRNVLVLAWAHFSAIVHPWFSPSRLWLSPRCCSYCAMT
jgi:hypothetical protein